MSENLSKPLRKKMGALLADFLKECAGASMPGLAEATQALRDGDLNNGYDRVRDFLRANAPLEQVVKAVRSELGEAAAGIEDDLRNGRYGPAVRRLGELSKGGNVYECDPLDFAQRLCGSFIGHVEDMGGETSGLVTHVAAYGAVPGYEKFTRAKPGTVGVYRRGRATVGTITVHRPGEEGCVSVWGVTLEDRKLGKKDIVDAFGFDVLSGYVVSECGLHIGLKDSALKVTSGYRSRKENIGSPGLGAYRLERV